MNAALLKLKNKLTSIHSHEELGIDSSSETILASYNEAQVGGLRYRATAALEQKMQIHVEVMHDQLDHFSIHIYTGDLDGLETDLMTRVSAPAKFDFVDRELKKLLEQISSQA